MRDNRRLPSYKSATLSKFPGCMTIHSPWQPLWSEQIFLHHRILNSCSNSSTQWWPPAPDYNLKTRVNSQVMFPKVEKANMSTAVLGMCYLDDVSAQLTLHQMLVHRRAPRKISSLSPTDITLIHTSQYSHFTK